MFSNCSTAYQRKNAHGSEKIRLSDISGNRRVNWSKITTAFSSTSYSRLELSKTERSPLRLTDLAQDWMDGQSKIGGHYSHSSQLQLETGKKNYYAISFAYIALMHDVARKYGREQAENTYLHLFNSERSTNSHRSTWYFLQ